MRPITLALLVCSSSLAVAVAANPRVRHDHTDRPCSRAKTVLSQATLDGLDAPPGLGIRIDASGDTDLLHNDLELEVDFGSGQIIGSNTMTVESLIDGLDTFTVRLNDAFTVDSALLNGVTPVSANPNTNNTAVVVLDRLYDSGEQFTLSIAYHGVPQASGFGSININTSSRTADSLSEPWGAADWFPCKDAPNGSWGDNSDKSTADIAIITPGDRSAVSNGVKQGVDNLSGGRLRHRFKTNYPTTTYLFCFAIDNFQPWTRSFTYDIDGSPVTMPVIFNIESDSWRGDQMVDMLTTFSDLYGPYPFINELYGVYKFSFGGGMEHQTNTGQSTLNWTSLNSHELGHQWWGDMITCQSWADLWLNEGFATYSEALWYEFENGTSDKDELHTSMGWRWVDVVDPVHRTSLSGLFSDVDYEKGAWVLHMLRWVIGDQAFFDTLATYRSNHEYATAEADDLLAATESASGIDLGWFFDQWVYNPAMPTYRTRDAVVNIAGQSYAAIHIDQQPASGTNAVEMPLAVYTYDGSAEQRELRSWVRTGDAHTVFVPLVAGEDQAELSDRWVLMHKQTSGPSYPFGPPKLLVASPAPDEVAADVDHIELTFSQDFTPTADKFTLVGPVGPVALSVSTPASFVVHLTPPAPLGPGTYTLTVADDLGGSDSLDGEIDGGQLEGFALPSGDGLPGGAAVWSFTVEPACAADLNGDGILNIADVTAFIDAFVASDPLADLNDDGFVNIADVTAFIDAFVAGC